MRTEVASGHNAATLDDHVEMIGGKMAVAMLAKFVADLDRSLKGEPIDTTGGRSVASDAHALIFHRRHVRVLRHFASVPELGDGHQVD
ncbi:hypothetical protein OCOJLMKI_1625 [Methylobacterium iners]|uniref:Uncharacterized protein n=2 Tax=Methylobacterium iners TaxID=418707 RepID=A0ABQ4RW55_9HYPH|nr:hypothetical protein OCOJLMKI_1625 [Methylobacterium iners]